MIISKILNESFNILIHNYEAKYLQNLFEEKFSNDYMLLKEKKNCYLLIKEFFKSTEIRYVNEKNIKENIYKFTGLLKEEIGRNYHNYEDSQNLDIRKILQQDDIEVSKGISGYTGKNNISVKTNAGLEVNIDFDSEEEAELYSKNAAYKLKRQV